MEKIIFVLNFSSTLMMAGIIWIVQIVQYPAMKFVGNENYTNFHLSHTTKISFIVAPLMIVELISSVALFAVMPPEFPPLLVWSGFICLLFIWISTFLVQIPLHEKLAEGFDLQTQSKLVKTNWFRTFAWTFRALTAMFFLYSLIK